MKAIVYCTQSGHTAQYAALLSQALSLPAYGWDDAKKSVSRGTEILFLSWLLAGGLKHYAEAAKRWRIAAVAAVGMGGPETDQREKIRQRHKLPPSEPLFYLRGGYAPEKLRGLNRLMMNAMAKGEIQRLEGKEARTPQEETTLRMWRDGASFVSEENLAELLSWCRRC